MISEEQLAEWERLANETTEGPWLHDDMADEITAKSRLVNDEVCIAIIYSGGNDRIKKEQAANAAFIAASREAVPALIAEVRRLAKLASEYFAIAEQYDSEADWLAIVLGKNDCPKNPTQCDVICSEKGRTPSNCAKCWREAARGAVNNE